MSYVLDHRFKYQTIQILDQYLRNQDGVRLPGSTELVWYSDPNYFAHIAFSLPPLYPRAAIYSHDLNNR